MKHQSAGSYTANSNYHYCVDAAGVRRKGLGLLVALLMLAATVTFSSCASQGLPGSNALNSTQLAAPNPFNTPGAGHDVSLNWDPSASSGVVGYNVYRATDSGGPYLKLNASLIAATSYTDDAVRAGQTYFYVVTAMTSANVESVYSNEVLAAIP